MSGLLSEVLFLERGAGFVRASAVSLRASSSALLGGLDPRLLEGDADGLLSGFEDVNPDESSLPINVHRFLPGAVVVDDSGVDFSEEFSAAPGIASPTEAMDCRL